MTELCPGLKNTFTDCNSKKERGNLGERTTWKLILSNQNGHLVTPCCSGGIQGPGV